MSLDLNDLVADWRCPEDEICARLVRGLNHEALVQLRVDVGLLQMCLEGRPDGLRYRGFPSALDFLRHELAVNRPLDARDWAELHRELQQYNYRRLAIGSLAEAAERRNERATECEHLTRCIADIDRCVEIIHAAAQADAPITLDSTLLPVLLFNRTRGLTRLRQLEGFPEEAIFEATRGKTVMCRLLLEAGLEADQVATEPSVTHLEEMVEAIRAEAGLSRTIHERLAAALSDEDFETAAALRDELTAQRAKLAACSSIAPSETDDASLAALDDNDDDADDEDDDDEPDAGLP